MSTLSWLCRVASRYSIEAKLAFNAFLLFLDGCQKKWISFNWSSAFECRLNVPRWIWQIKVSSFANSRFNVSDNRAPAVTLLVIQSHDRTAVQLRAGVEKKFRINVCIEREKMKSLEPFASPINWNSRAWTRWTFRLPTRGKRVRSYLLVHFQLADRYACFLIKLLSSGRSNQVGFSGVRTELLQFERQRSSICFRGEGDWLSIRLINLPAGRGSYVLINRSLFFRPHRLSASSSISTRPAVIWDSFLPVCRLRRRWTGKLSYISDEISKTWREASKWKIRLTFNLRFFLPPPLPHHDAKITF